MEELWPSFTGNQWKQVASNISKMAEPVDVEYKTRIHSCREKVGNGKNILIHGNSQQHFATSKRYQDATIFRI